MNDYTIQQAHDFLIRKFTVIGSNEPVGFTRIMKRLNTLTIKSGIEAGRWIEVDINGFVFHIHEDSGFPMFFCLNRELAKTVKNKINTRVKRMLEANEREEYLDKCIEYPFTSGHMECVNRSVDEWAPTKRHNIQVEAASNKWCKALDEIVEIAKANWCLSPEKLFELMPELGKQIAPEFIFETYSEQL